VYTQYYEGGKWGIYSLQQEGKLVCDIKSEPFFNPSRTAVFSYYTGVYAMDGHFSLYTIQNGVYSKQASPGGIEPHIIHGHPIEDTGSCWINDNEFQINYTNIESEARVSLLVRRNDPNSAFELVRQ
jgi:hypothetical protein